VHRVISQTIKLLQLEETRTGEPKMNRRDAETQRRLAPLPKFSAPLRLGGEKILCRAVLGCKFLDKSSHLL
jgi:hypothetical protein